MILYIASKVYQEEPIKSTKLPVKEVLESRIYSRDGAVSKKKHIPGGM